MTFEEMLEQLRNPGEQGIPADFADQLHAAYQNDISVRDAAVKDREQKIQETIEAQARHEAEITRLKAVNYDLLIAAPKPGDPAGGNEELDDAEPHGIDSLFEKEIR
jgi:hypothetical protein